MKASGTKASPARKGNAVKDNKKSENGTNSRNVSQKAKKKNGMMAKIVELDEHYTRLFAVCANKDSSYSFLRPVMKVIEISCHGVPWLLGTGVLLLSVHKATHVETLVNLLYGLILDLIVIAVLKATFRRSRPAHNEMDMFGTVSVDHYSFPSGHASRVSMLSFFFILQVTDELNYWLLIGLWCLIVSLSRVILGRHHVIDVLCGFVAGYFEYLLLLFLWIPTETCMNWLELYFSHFHL